jgi:hypothetical protein
MAGRKVQQRVNANSFLGILRENPVLVSVIEFKDTP